MPEKEKTAVKPNALRVTGLMIPSPYGGDGALLRLGDQAERLDLTLALFKGELELSLIKTYD